MAARQRLRLLQSIPLLDITPEVAELTSDILASGKIPRKPATDAAHIAIAAVHGIDFLVTWRARESEAAKHRFDVKAILSAAKKRQRRSGRRVVSFVQETQKLNA